MEVEVIMHVILPVALAATWDPITVATQHHRQQQQLQQQRQQAHTRHHHNNIMPRHRGKSYKDPNSLTI